MAGPVVDAHPGVDAADVEGASPGEDTAFAPVPRRPVLPRSVGTALLLLPTVALLGVFFVWPLVGILLRSLHPDGALSWTQPEFTFAHYKELLDRPALRLVLRNTVAIALWATVFSLVVAYPTAYLLSRLRRRTAMTLLVLVLIAFWSSILIRLYAFTQILGRRGIVNEVASTVGAGPFDLLFNRTATVIGMVHYLLPYLILILYANMAGIDQNLMTAARSLGASTWQAFRRVFFPLTKPAVVGGSLLTFVLGLGFFLTPAVLGGARDTTMAVYIEQQVDILNWGVASAMGITLLVAVCVLFTIAVRVSGSASLTTAGSQRGVSQHVPLGRGPAIALGAVTAGALGFLLLPLLVIVPVSFSESSYFQFPPGGFSLRWYEAFFTDRWLDPAWKSGKVAVIVAVVATALAVMVARALARMRSWWMRALLQLLLYAPLIAPVILLAVGTFDVQSRLGLLRTDSGLVVAHAVLAVPFAFAVVSSALAGVDPNLEEAAWTLGASKRSAFYRITLRIVMPSVLAALLLAFISSWDEVVIALFQTGIEKTLPVTIFSYLETGVPPTVAALGSMVLGVALVGIVVSGFVRRVRSIPTT